MRNGRIGLVLIALLAAVGLSAPAVAIMIGGQAQVIDGDTIILRGKHVRLAGIDAPELRQTCNDASKSSYPCGRVAADALKTKIGGAPLRCNGSQRDKYGNVLATCWLGVENLNSWMVQAGLAVANPFVSSRYIPQEDDAKSAQRGLWAGQFAMPWDWRADHQP